jgi:Protein chain release factor A
VQRVPATEKSGRVHTSTVTVAVLPQPEEVKSEDTLTIYHYGVCDCTRVLWFVVHFKMFGPLLGQTVMEFAEVYIVLNYYCFISGVS